MGESRRERRKREDREVENRRHAAEVALGRKLRKRSEEDMASRPPPELPPETPPD